MRHLPTIKTLLTIAAMALATAGLVACGNTDADKSPDSVTADELALPDSSGEAQVDQSGLPADVPFYLGKRNEDAAWLLALELSRQHQQSCADHHQRQTGSAGQWLGSDQRAKAERKHLPDGAFQGWQ